MTLPRVLLATIVLLLAPRAWGEIGIGDTRQTVLQQAGDPTSHATRGNREILLYPHGARVELIDGKVVDVKGPLPTKATTPETPAEPSAPAPAPAATASSVPSKTSPTKAPTNKPAPAAGLTAEQLNNPAVAANALGNTIEKMDTAWGERPKMPTTEDHINWPRLAVSIFLHFAITLLALKLAFKIEEMDALWSGVFAIVGIDVGVYAMLELLGPLTHGLSSMATIESAMGALVMIFTIQNFCFTKKLQYAIATAAGVKLIGQLCHMFVFVLLLNALFG